METVPQVAGYFRVKVQLDWSRPGHYDARAELPCRICRVDTPQRDSGGAAAHQVCVQAELEAQALAFLRSLLVRASAGAPRRSRPLIRSRRARARRALAVTR